MKHPPDEKRQHAAIQQYSSTVAGMHNYYQFATHICEDFCQIAKGIKKQLGSRLKELTRNGKLERGFIKERYGKSRQLRFLNGHPIIPVAYIRTKDALHKKKSANRYLECYHKSTAPTTRKMIE